MNGRIGDGRAGFIVATVNAIRLGVTEEQVLKHKKI